MNKLVRHLAARTNTYTWDELNDEQKKQVLNTERDINHRSTQLTEFFCEDLMSKYKKDVKELANEFERKTGTKADITKMEWECYSRRPYYNFNHLGQVLTPYTIANMSARNAMLSGDYDIIVRAIKQDNFDVKLNITLEEDDYNIEDDGYGTSNDIIRFLQQYDNCISQEDIDKVATYTQEVNDFIDKNWDLIREVCDSYPDADYIENIFNCNNFKFEFDENGKYIRFI